MTFDLEKMREVAGFMRSYHHYGGERFTEALDEIERLRAELASANVELMAAGEIVMAAKQLRTEGKIGPDVMPRSWQITDERTTALDRVLNYMDYMYPKSSPYYHCTLDVSVLRAMLEGAGQ